MMKMFFHFSIMETILFQSWMPKTEFQMTISCFLLLMLTITLEFIKTLRIYLQQKNCSSNCTSSGLIGEQTTSDQEPLIFGWTRKGRKHLFDTALYGVQLTISYVLMLAVMTYNLWIFASIILGAIIGYFLFGEDTFAQDRTKDAHCN